MIQLRKRHGLVNFLRNSRHLREWEQSPGFLTREVDGGRFAVKRVVGEPVDVSAHRPQRHAQPPGELAVAHAIDIGEHDRLHAVAETELALETLVSVRDRVIQAYEEIMRMPI